MLKGSSAETLEAEQDPLEGSPNHMPELADRGAWFVGQHDSRVGDTDSGFGLTRVPWGSWFDPPNQTKRLFSWAVGTLGRASGDKGARLCTRSP